LANRTRKPQRKIKETSQRMGKHKKMTSRYQEHKQGITTRGGIESWLGYVNITQKAGQDLFKNRGDYDAQLDIIKQISNEDFIGTVISNYQGDPTYDYHFRRLITAVIEASGANLGKNEELTMTQKPHEVSVHDGRNVHKKTVTRKKGKKTANYELWTKSQKTFIAVRVKQGKSRDQITKEYNYSKSFRNARTKQSINSEIDRQAAQ